MRPYELAHFLQWRTRTLLRSVVFRAFPGGDAPPARGIQTLAHLLRFRLALAPTEREYAAIEGIVGTALRGRTALDIGAHYGEYSWLLARLVGRRGAVYAFEPYGPTASALAWGVRWLGPRTIRVVASAVAEHDGSLPLSEPLAADRTLICGQVHVAPDRVGLPPVPSVSVDDFCSRRGVGSVGFIKIDVEGYEGFVIRGAAQTISAHRPAILCEIEERWCSRYGHSGENTLRSLARLGNYSVHVVDRESGRLIATSSLIDGINNYLFLPC